MIKILIVTESAILPTGMAEVIRLIFETIVDNYPNQYELHQVGLFHSHAVTKPRWPVYPTKGGTDKDGRVFFLTDDLYGQRTFLEVVLELRPDIVFAHNDSQRTLHLCTEPAKRTYKLVLYVNFDGFPFPPDQGPILDNADLIVTLSEFSKRVVTASLPAIKPDKVEYLYSPADTARFLPLTDTKKMELRNQALPDWMPRDAFLLGWVGRNQWRKQVWILYSVIHYLRTGDYLVCNKCNRVTLRNRGPLPAHHANDPCGTVGNKSSVQPEACGHCRSVHVEKAAPLADVFLWLHMPDEPDQQAWDRSWLEQQFGLISGKDIHYTEGHKIGNFKSPGEMPTLYQLWDCLLYLSGGEGFGMPAWEAMCSALPVVYTNYSSHAEFLNKAGAGLPVGGILQPEKETCIWRMIADVSQAIEAVRKLYFDRALGRTLGSNGRSFVQQYTPAIQAERWHQIFQRMRSLDREKCVEQDVTGPKKSVE